MPKQAPTLVPLALAGGQGKTTIALMTGRILASYGIPVLFVDADPQASLTAFLGVDPEDRPTLLEVLTRSPDKLPLFKAIHAVPESENIFLIPSTDELENANHSLAASPSSINVLRNRIQQVGEQVKKEEKITSNFGIIIIDPPPERSHLALTSLGSGDCWVICAEANIKGVQSLKRTKGLIETCQSMVPAGELIGTIPFRAKWTGLNPTKVTRTNIEVMEVLVGKDLMLPHVLESDIYKRAIDEQTLPGTLGYEHLEFPLRSLIERMRPSLGKYAKSIPVLNTEEN
ncbi:ParA family protein [Acaryochloris marina]|uniref:ParA family protein n=1 Tax=Acaryochloris marina TaxID=155978 RepID=UPI001BAF7C1E|nr:ParA family protein [Acaryochloris marina]QUY45637.1 ParA family protein [Acaryochloris marina S15]